MAVVVAVAVADGRGVCGWFFWVVAYIIFIVMVILFYCDVYIILLC